MDWNDLQGNRLFELVSSHSTRVRGLKLRETKQTARYAKSHSTRVRGLKLPKRNGLQRRLSRTLHECVDWNLNAIDQSLDSVWSHSTRVRGLKWRSTVRDGRENKSHSTRVRGLKCNHASVSIIRRICRTLHECVDWNTHSFHHLPASMKSHSTRVRGLKYASRRRYSAWSWVALYTSAWIEIIVVKVNGQAYKSHSTRVRGLKWYRSRLFCIYRTSHSTRVRGLKLNHPSS